MLIDVTTKKMFKDKILSLFLTFECLKSKISDLVYVL